MRILLDKCVSQNAQSPAWARMPIGSVRGLWRAQEGELLDAAEAAGFDVLMTVDRGFRNEQNLAGRKIAVVIFRTKSIALKDLLENFLGLRLECRAMVTMIASRS
jgi:predicted nuclease of predicted toxin-antitoxin system